MREINVQAAIIAQNSATASSNVVAALIANGNEPWTFSEVEEAIDKFQTVFFNNSVGLANAADLTKEAGSTPPRSAASGGSGGGGADPGSVAFNSGKMAGKTIAQVYASTPDYLEWCVTAPQYKNEFMKGRIQAYLDSQE